MDGSLEERLGLSEWTSDNDGIGGVLKSRVEDFRVEEISKIPALDPKGRFTVARITMVNWETNRFLKRLSKACGISRNRIFSSGMKDKRAVTTQIVVIDSPLYKVEKIKIPDSTIEIIGRTHQKIGMSDHDGNSFTITVRGCCDSNGVPLDGKEAMKRVNQIREDIMITEIKNDAKERMKKSTMALNQNLTKIRTGRANTSLLDQITVDYYGSETALSQVSNISIEDSRTLKITPWEKDMIQPIEKAIMNSNLGLNPVSAGMIIRVPLPPLTEERRKDMIRVVRQEGEQSRVAVRNIRRDAINDLKEMLKDKMIGEDEERKGEEEIQEITDKYVGEIDQILITKEKELMIV